MRLLSATWSDIRFQIKHGFFLVYVIITIMYLIILSFLPENIFNLALPLVVFSDPFSAGIVFYRRDHFTGKGTGSIDGIGCISLAQPGIHPGKSDFPNIHLCFGCPRNHLLQPLPISQLGVTNYCNHPHICYLYTNRNHDQCRLQHGKPVYAQNNSLYAAFHPALLFPDLVPGFLVVFSVPQCGSPETDDGRISWHLLV